MALDNRFNIRAFEEASRARRETLSAELQQEINEELHRIVLPAIKDIVGALAKLGHDLRPYLPPVPGDISYRDDTVDGQYECRLRLGVDVIVSVGFRDTRDDLEGERT